MRVARRKHKQFASMKVFGGEVRVQTVDTVFCFLYSQSVYFIFSARETQCVLVADTGWVRVSVWCV